MASVCPSCMAEGNEIRFEDADEFHAHMSQHTASAPVRFIVDISAEGSAERHAHEQAHEHEHDLVRRVDAMEGTLATAVSALEAFQGRLIAQNFNIQSLVKTLREITQMLQEILNLLSRLGTSIEAVAGKLAVDPNALTGSQAIQIRDALTSIASRVEALLASTTTQPTLTAQVSGLAGATAVVTWTTPELSDSQVEYGTTPNYGQQSALDQTQVMTHAVTLAGLTPNTLYHFRVKSTTTAGVLRVSSNATFLTPTA